jgi:H+/Cl- antiporter ClcA
MSPVVQNSWVDVLMSIEPGQRWLLLVIAIGCSVGLILGLAGLLMRGISSIQKHRAELALKREMLERGMSADEIATVIAASSGKTSV